MKVNPKAYQLLTMFEVQNCSSRTSPTAVLHVFQMNKSIFINVSAFLNFDTLEQ